MTFKNTIYTDDIKDVTLSINGDEWFLLQTRVELSTATTPNYVDMIISPTIEAAENLSDDPTKRQENGGLLGTTFSLEVDTELAVGDRSSGPIKIFTGNLANLSTAGEGSWEAVAWDPSHQTFASGEGEGNEGNFLNSTIDISAATEEGETTSEGGSNGTSPDYETKSQSTPGATKIEATKLVEIITDEAIADSSSLEKDDVKTNFADNGIKIGEQPDGTEIVGGIDREISFQNQYITVSKALERIKNSTNSTWWFDKEGVFHIGAAEIGNPIDSYNLSFIIDTSAGTSTPAWQGVRVIGSGVVSEDGWSKSNMNSDNLTLAVATAKNNGKTDKDALAKPVYTYRNLEIQTQAEADSVAEEIVNDLREQQAEGKITVVGFPEIRPLDAVQMPQSNDSSGENYNSNQPMGGARYSVVKVVHKINPDDGFITDIHVGGLTRENSTVYSEDVDTSDEAIVDAYAPRRSGL